MEVADRIRAESANLTAAERRVAEAILAAPQAVGFGTVADLARAADVGAASVVRLAAKLGYDGYSALQQSIQRELTLQLRPAAERIREADGSPRSGHTAIELGNVQATIDAIDEGALEQLVTRIADVTRPVAIVSGDASAGVARQFAGQLDELRPGVSLVGGSEVAVQRSIALLDVTATAIVIDLRRYERWVLDAHATLHRRGVWSAGVTDSLLSPIASTAEVAFVVSAGSSGPFDSHVGTLALLNLIATHAASALRTSAETRLAEVEEAWTARGSLIDPD